LAISPWRWAVPQSLRTTAVPVRVCVGTREQT
jgi:hypothetical protein